MDGKNEETQDQQSQIIGRWTAIGIAIGAGIGVVFDNIAIGIGLAFDAAVGAAQVRSLSRKA